MPSILIIEDGSGVANANSYATAAQARNYAALRGLTLPDAPDDDSITDPVEQFLVNACDYLETLIYKGDPTTDTQPLQWPRQNVFLNGSITEFPEDEIPAKLIQAQCQLCFDASTIDLLPTGTGQEVIMEKVDVIETQYNPTGSGTVMPVLNKANSLLSQLLRDGGGFSLTTIRA